VSHQRTIDDGFSLIEVLVSMTLVLVLATAALSLVAGDARRATHQPDVVDVQQRARGAADLIAADLQMAGAGMDRGPLSGRLRLHLPPILPRRAGLLTPDAPTVACANAITLIHVPQTAAQSTLRDALSSAALNLRVNALPNCAAGGALCGFSKDASVLAFKNSGEFDFYSVIQTIGDSATLRPWRSGPSAYPIGTPVTLAESDTYYHDTQALQLRHFDGFLTDIPVVDGVSGLEVEYFGDPQPPRFPALPIGLAPCLFDAGGTPVAGQIVLPPQGGSLASLPLGMFTDGPWCGSGANQFDVDVLRIRRVRMTLRFTTGHTVRIDVAPRNMSWAQ
jgi:prepilin-type N-terminal cleavage/methylation domain-containing protein